MNQLIQAILSPTGYEPQTSRGIGDANLGQSLLLLTPIRSQVLQMHYLENLPIKYISRKISRPSSYIRTQLHQGLHCLRMKYHVKYRESFLSLQKAKLPWE